MEPVGAAAQREQAAASLTEVAGLVVQLAVEIEGLVSADDDRIGPRAKAANLSAGGVKAT